MTSVSIEQFGARSNSNELQTRYIQEAIDYVYSKGGGEVIIPEGVFLTGDIRIRSRIKLHLLKNAVLQGSRNPEDYFNYRDDKIEPLDPEEITDAPYVHVSTIENEMEYIENRPEYRFKRLPGSRWNNAIIRAIDAHDIEIIGEENSVIDGNNCFDAIGEEDYRGPHGMAFFRCSNIKLSGYTLRDAGNWAHHLLFCKNIEVEGITVLAGHDGFDAAACQNLYIAGCEFYTGDDCIAGFSNINVYVTGCVLNSSCSAMRFGGTNVLVEKCNIYGPGKYNFRGSLSDEEKRASAPSNMSGGRNNMLSAFTYFSDFSLPVKVQPGNIEVVDCVIENADRFIHYNFSGNETWQKNRPLKNIEFRNIKATNVSMPLTFYGDEELKASLTLRNVSLNLREGFTNIDLVHACNYKDIIFDHVNINNYEGNALVKVWSDGNVEFHELQCCVDEEHYVVNAKEEFYASPI